MITQLDAPVRDLKGLNRSWIHAFNERDWTMEKTFRTPNFRAHLSGTPEPLNSDAWAGFLMAFTQAFPDSQIAIDVCIADGDMAATNWTISGTHKGPFQGIPASGRAVKFSGLELNRFVDGRIVEHWGMFDNLALLQQIGALPPR